MVKKKYRIKASGNIKDTLRTGKIKFSCVSEWEPFEKTLKITQSKATRDHYCRPAFYRSIEDIPVGGDKIKMSLIYNGDGENFKLEYPNWVSLTRIDPNDNLAPIQYWVEISPNDKASRIGQIKVSYEHAGQTYYESYIITQLGDEYKNIIDSSIKINPEIISDAEFEGQIVPVEVEYIGIKIVRDPFFSPYDKDWVWVQKLDEMRSTNKTTILYNVGIKPNDTPDPRVINLMFSGLSENNKEIQMPLNIIQGRNSEIEKQEN